MEYLNTNKCQNSSQLVYLNTKYQLAQKCQIVLKKYSNGEYGFEHPTSKSGRFQIAVIKLVDKVLNGHFE